MKKLVIKSSKYGYLCLKNVVIIAIFLLFTLTIVFLYWLSKEPREIGWLKEYAISMIVDEDDGYSIKSDKAIAYFDWHESSILLRMEDFRVINNNEISIVTLPKVTVGINLWPLFIGKGHIKKLAFHDSDITLFRQHDGSLDFTFDKIDKGINSNEYELENKSSQSYENSDVEKILGSFFAHRFEVLSFENSILRLGSGNKKLLLQSPLIRLEHRKSGGGKHDIAISAELKNQNTPSGQLEEKNTILTGALSLDNNLSLKQAYIAFDNFALKSVAAIDWRLKRLQSLDATLSGNAKIEFSKNSKFNNLRIANSEIHFMSGAGKFADQQLFDEEINFNNIEIKANYKKDSDNSKLLTLDGITLDLHEGMIQAKGEVRLYENETLPLIALDGTIEDIPVAHIKRYWPKITAPWTRKWVLTNVDRGIVKKGVAHINMTPEDMRMPVFPRETIDVALNLKEGRVRYLPDFPYIKDIDAIVRIDGLSLEVEGLSATTMSGTSLLGASVAIPDLFAAGVPMEMEAHMRSPALDIAEILSAKYLGLVPEVNLKPGAVSGHVVGSMAMVVPLYSGELKDDNPIYDINVELEDISQNNILKRWDVRDFSGQLNINNNKLLLKGNGKFEGVKSSVEADMDFIRDIEIYNVKANVPSEKFDALGVNAPSFIKGLVGVDAVLTRKNNTERTKASLNLDQASIKLPEYHFSKNKGSRLNADIEYITNGGANINVNKLDLKGDNIALNGSLKIGRKTHEPTSINFKNLKIHDSDMSLIMSPVKGGQKYDIIGKTLDLSLWINSGDKQNQKAGAQKNKKTSEDNSPFEFFENKHIKINVARLKMDNGKSLRDVLFKLNCLSGICNNGNLKAIHSDGKSFTMSLKRNESGVRSLHMVSHNAGELAASLGVSEHVKGGQLTYKGEFKGVGNFEGRLIITAFHIVNGPILSRLISLASISGAMNTLRGKGIHFKKMSVDTYVNNQGLFKLKDGRAHGNALGITAEGNINAANGAMKIKGTFVPSYTANSIVGRIPIVGEALAGGFGEGLIAMNYSLNKEPDKGVDISVNPLSLLTPGFLRKLFDIFYEDESQKSKENKAKRRSPAGPANRNAQRR